MSLACPGGAAVPMPALSQGDYGGETYILRSRSRTVNLNGTGTTDLMNGRVRGESLSIHTAIQLD